MVVLRTDYPVEDDVIAKTALFCDVDREAVVPLLTSETIYAVPLSLEESGLGSWTMQRLNLVELQPAETGLVAWRHFVDDLLRKKPRLRIALVGKYVELEDSYLSVKEALIHAGLAVGWDIEMDWVNSEDLEKGRGVERLTSADGVIVPGGFGYRGIEGKISRGALLPANKIALPGALPGHASHVH